MIAVFILASMAVASPMTSDWWLLTTTRGDYRTILYLDANSVSGNEGHKLVWLEHVYETRSEYGAKRAKSRVEVDCRTRLIGAKELRSFDARGEEVTGYTAVIDKPEMKPVPAGTVYEDVLFFLCDGKRNYDHLADGKSPLNDSAEVFGLLNKRDQRRER